MALIALMAGCKPGPKHPASKPPPTMDPLAVQLADSIKYSGAGIRHAVWKRSLQIPEERSGSENGTDWKERTIRVHNSELLITEYFEAVTKRYVHVNGRPVFAHRLNGPFTLDSMNIVIDFLRQGIFAYEQDPSYILLVSPSANWVGTMGGEYRFCQLISARNNFMVEFMWEVDEESMRVLRNWKQAKSR